VLPETGVPVDRHDSAHQALIMLLGAQSRREVQRSRFRVTAAMRTQTREQGRYLGGRPPYGYRLADAGSHPNTALARWGHRAGDRWTARTIATILENPRYTGRQVWNRQCTDHTTTSHGQKANSAATRSTTVRTRSETDAE
jgi:DNA invertase Pin-like site-specific DNA recombinase